MPNKELDKMREKIAGIIRFGLEGTPNYIKADEILAKKTSNGYSLEEMIEFFGKIKPDTQREAVVKRKTELPPLPNIGFVSRGSEEGLVTGARQERNNMLAKHFVEEVKEDGV